MEQETYYFRVGLFVILIFAGFMLTLGWLAGRRDDTGRVPYAIYFSGSVDGLSLGSPVKLKGIEVGNVTEIGFAPQNNQLIRVLADIKDTAPITTDTIASLQLQGITGTSIIALESAGGHPERLFRKDEEGYLVIASKTSSLERVVTSVPQLIEAMTKLAKQGQALFDDKNIAAVQTMLASVAASAQTLNQIVNGDSKRSVETTLLEFNTMLTEGRSALREIKMLARTIREDPSVLIHGTQHEGYKVP